MNKIYPYAGFWKRAIAYFIDSLVLFIPQITVWVGCIFLVFRTHLHGGDSFPTQLYEQTFTQLTVLLNTVMWWLYFAWMESSSYQGTLGKIIMGIKVVDKDGNRLSFGHASCRFLGKYLSGLTMCVGFLMAGATRKKQALHDKTASTYVVDKNFKPGDALPDVPTHFGILGVTIGLMILSWVALVALFIGLIAYAVQHIDKKAAPSQTKVTTSIQTGGTVDPVGSIGFVHTTKRSSHE